VKPVDRRDFLRRLAGAALIPSAMGGLVAACTELDGEGGLARRTTRVPRAGLGSGGYGPLDNDRGPLVLPDGFQLRSFGAIGDPMSDGNPTPIAPDGMAAFPADGNRVRLVRNHEDRNGPRGRPLVASYAYDSAAGGGCTTLEVGADRELVRDFVSLSGTTVNCAGGPTPWGSWLSCEETVVGRSEGFERTHGWIFEVPAAAEEPVQPVPLRAMGRFSHEAVAVDPVSGVVYETEDHQHPPGSGFYRFLPREPGNLAAGGQLEMAAVTGEPRLELFRGSGLGIEVGQTFEVEWAAIGSPEVDPDDEMSQEDRLGAVFAQGFEGGGAVFSRLEGCWWGDESVYFHDTTGGAAELGHVWRYVPERITGGRGKLVLLFESPAREVLDGPDNITVSPRGGLVLCEDPSGVPYVRGLTPEGRIFDLARNNLNRAEFAGATFSPDGQTLFVNIQGPTRGSTAEGAGEGMTLAIWGPWERGSL